MGGQAGTSSMIRNYLGFPRGISGAELAARAFEQAILFGTEMVYGNSVVGLAATANSGSSTLADGTEIPSRAVVIATGRVVPAARHPPARSAQWVGGVLWRGDVRGGVAHR